MPNSQAALVNVLLRADRRFCGQSGPDAPNRVWCADITYIPMKRGYLHLVMVLDWFSRAVLSWRLSNTMDADFYVAALEEAMNRYGVPETFNTDQGSQFTSYEFTRTLRKAGVRISMDGRGRWMDNVMVEPCGVR